MRAFLLVSACLVACVAARPEAPYIYNGQQQPQPQQQQQQQQRALPLNAHPAQPHVYQQLPQEQSFLSFGLPQMNYLPPSAIAAAPVPTEQLLPIESSIAPELQPQEPLQQPQFEDSYNMAHRLSSTPHASGYSNAPVETKVHKHIYVHVPPKDFEEEDAVQPRVHHQVGPKQKHYKIVFIKAPSAPAIRAPIVPPAPQNEEKTLIYVLHKKPEQEQDIIIPTPPPTKPSKPEVYFIKYKTKKEEAPVYGPPPAGLNDMEPRQGAAGATAEDFAPMDIADILPTTTAETMAEEQQQPQQQQQQLVPEVPLPSPVYGAPTAPTATYAAPEEIQTTLAAPSNQYLPPGGTAPSAIASEPSMTPIIVEEEQQQQQQQHVPAANYGPPNRFFIKKRNEIVF